MLDLKVVCETLIYSWCYHLTLLSIIIDFHLILKAYSTLDISVHLFEVQFAMKLTYRTLPFDDDELIRGADAEITKTGQNSSKTQWDDDCPWSEWYSSEDPVKGN